MRVLALDAGRRRIGVAISDPAGRFAVPLRSIERRDLAQDLAAVQSLVTTEGVACVVVGLPLSLSGERGAQAVETEEFVEHLRGELPVPVEVWDERLSSVEAERRLREGRTSRRGARQRPADKGQVDALAATIVLQSYLDSRSQE